MMPTPGLRMRGTIGLLIVGLVPLMAAGQETDLSSRLLTRFVRFVEQKEIAGAVLLVGSHDQVTALVTAGRRDQRDDHPMRQDTLFRIASMTKPITACGIMMLADAGKLAIDDPVMKHLPEFKGQMLVAARAGGTITLRAPSRPITLRDLLTHTSGLPGSPPPGLSDLYTRRNHTLAEAVMAFSQRPLEFEPGSKWAYCNTGIDTLGRVIEVVSGRLYPQFLKERIFDPLGMADTTFFPTPEQLDRTAATFDVRDGALIPAQGTVIGPPAGAIYPIPAGGLYSTAPDLARFYQMMLQRGTFGGRRFLSESTVREMTRVQTGDLKAGFTDGMGFGLGWGVVRQPSGVTAMLSPGTFGHGGAFGTQAWIDPTRDRFVVMMIQRVGLRNGDASPMRMEFQRIAYED